MNMQRKSAIGASSGVRISPLAYAAPGKWIVVCWGIDDAGTAVSVAGGDEGGGKRVAQECGVAAVSDGEHAMIAGVLPVAAKPWQLLQAVPLLART
jgi:hypothetical protein